MAIPSDVATLYAWYKSDSFALGDGATCGTWTDSSGNGRNLTDTSGAVFKTNQIASYPAIQYTTSDYHRLSTFNWLASLGTCTIFCVFKMTSTLGGGNGSIFTSEGGSGAEGIGWDGTNAYMRGGNASVKAYGGALAVSTWAYMYGCQTSGGHVGCSLNSATEATAAITGRGATTQPGTFALDGGAFTNVDVAELFVFNSDLSTPNKLLMNDYLNAKYFNVVPTQNDKVRDVLSRRLWLLRRPNGIYEATVPLWMLDADILDRISIESRTGPDPSGQGWGGKKWQRRAFSIQRMDFNPGDMSVKLQLLDRRPLDISLWDNGMSNVSGLASIDAGRENGVARIDMGNTRTYSRASKAWVVNPADETSCVEVVTSRPAIDFDGELFESAATNLLLRSSFVSGTTGLTIGGTGSNGSSIATDSTDKFFNTETGATSLKFTAGNPTMAGNLYVQFPAATVTANQKVVLSIDHKTDSGEALAYSLLRFSDGKVWDNDTATWVVAKDNALSTSTSRNPANRYVSKVIDVGASNTVLVLFVFLTAAGTAGRVSHLYHVQLEANLLASSRIITDASTYTRADTTLSYASDTGSELINPNGVGTFYCEFIPNWNEADLLGRTPSSKRVWGIYGLNGGTGSDWCGLFYDGYWGNFLFFYWVGGAGYYAYFDTSTVTPLVRGEPHTLACRWTSPSGGELGLAAGTLDVFVDGIKGVSGVRPALTYALPSTLDIGHMRSDAGYRFDGIIRNRRFYPYALTDEEIANMEVSG
jgi:hypothetical protein